MNIHKSQRFWSGFQGSPQYQFKLPKVPVEDHQSTKAIAVLPTTVIIGSYGQWTSVGPFWIMILWASEIHLKDWIVSSFPIARKTSRKGYCTTGGIGDTHTDTAWQWITHLWGRESSNPAVSQFISQEDSIRSFDLVVWDCFVMFRCYTCIWLYMSVQCHRPLLSIVAVIAWTQNVAMFDGRICCLTMFDYFLCRFCSFCCTPISLQKIVWQFESEVGSRVFFTPPWLDWTVRGSHR